ncbi:MAG TPA: HU family DNA-binding protein [Armatimonadota bacterium]|jgi:nucleoid DNA-binding protein
MATLETLNKTQIAEAVAKETGLSKVAATGAVDAVLATITASLKKGKVVQFTGFGSFSVVKTKARQGVNPQTGEKIKIAARKTPKFKAGANLKKSVL